MAADDSNNRNNEDADAENVHRRTQQQVANDGTDAPRPENVGGVSAQQQGANKLTSSPDSFGDHGGNRSGTNETPQDAKGSSNRGDRPNNVNDGGGPDTEKANQTKNTTAYNSEYSNARSTPSSANDGGKMGDADNPA
ncbi:hypothetical protein [Hymenobacter sp. B1770]|uniref:hypothetical protein n=1 Tax=Hymenobacter sp. B1770 TaxID=1718788 RepID=UPI003CE9C5F7